MGISGLWRLLLPIGRRISLETLAGQRLAIDASIWLTQFLKAMRDPETGRVQPAAHLVGFFRRLCRLRYHGIRPVLVFDGVMPEAKRRELQRRRARREQFAKLESSTLQRMAKRLLAQQLATAATTAAAAKSKSKASTLVGDSGGGNQSDSKTTTTTVRGAFAPGFCPTVQEQQNSNESQETAKPTAKQETSQPESTKESGGAGTQRNSSNQKVVPESEAVVSGQSVTQGISATLDSGEKEEEEVTDFSELDQKPKASQRGGGNDWDDAADEVISVPSDHENNKQTYVNKDNEDNDNDYDDDEWENDDDDDDVERANDFTDDMINSNDHHEFMDHLLSLKPHQRKDAIEDAKRRQRLLSRKSFMPAAANPLKFSQVQVQNFLKSTRLNESIVKMAKKAVHQDEEQQYPARGRRHGATATAAGGHLMDSDRMTLIELIREDDQEEPARARHAHRVVAESPTAARPLVSLQRKRPAQTSKLRRRLARFGDHDDEDDEEELWHEDLGSVEERNSSFAKSSNRNSAILDSSEDDGEVYSGAKDVKQPNFFQDSKLEAVDRTSNECSAPLDKDSDDESALILETSNDNDTNNIGCFTSKVVVTKQGRKRKTYLIAPFAVLNAKRRSVSRRQANIASAVDEFDKEENVNEDCLAGDGGSRRSNIVAEKPTTYQSAVNMASVSATQDVRQDRNIGSICSKMAVTIPRPREGLQKQSNWLQVNCQEEQSSAQQESKFSALSGLREVIILDSSDLESDAGVMGAMEPAQHKKYSQHLTSHDQSSNDQKKPTPHLPIHAPLSGRSNSLRTQELEDEALARALQEAEDADAAIAVSQAGIEIQDLLDNFRTYPVEFRVHESMRSIAGSSSINADASLTGLPTKQETPDDDECYGDGDEEDNIDWEDGSADRVDQLAAQQANEIQHSPEQVMTEMQSRRATSTAIEEDEDDDDNLVEWKDGESQVTGRWKKQDKNDADMDMKIDGIRDENEDWVDREISAHGASEGDMADAEMPYSAETTAVLERAQAEASNLANWAGRVFRRAMKEVNGAVSHPSPEKKGPESQRVAGAVAYAFKDARQESNNCSIGENAAASDTNKGNDVALKSDVLQKAAEHGNKESISSELDADTWLLLEENEQEWAAERNQKERDTDMVTDEMREECIRLLELFGIPYIIAPAEAEAQCAALEDLGLVDGVVTEDSDVFVFGAKTVYKNIFEEQKYAEVYKAADAQREMKITRHEFVALAMLLGGDYTEGVKGKHYRK